MKRSPRSRLTDVAKAAGVSLATVDRVMNGRPGVREETVQRVGEAISRLGFRRDAYASSLARGVSHHFAFLLPTGGNTFMRLLGEQVRLAAHQFAAQRVTIDLRWVDVFDSAALQQALAAVEDGVQGVAVVALDHPVIRAGIDALVDRGISVVTLVSDAPASRRLRFVGIDNSAAGRTAATLTGRFLGSRSGSIGVVMGSRGLRDHAERLYGFNQVMSQDFPIHHVLVPVEGRDDTERNASLVADLLRRTPDLVAIYNVGAGNRGIAAALRQAGRAHDVVFIGHELTEHSRAFLLDGSMDAVIHQDAGHEARSAVRLLLAQRLGEPVFEDREKVGIQIYLRDNLP